MPRPAERPLLTTARRLLTEQVGRRLYYWRQHLRTVRLSGLEWRLELPDRRVLEDTILPAIDADTGIGEVLFVGCRWYTRRYERLLGAKRFTTIERDKAHARHGSRQRHIVADFLALGNHVSADSFDAIIINGVFGWGIDTPDETEAALDETWRALKPGGLLVVGFNDTEANPPSFLEVPSPGLARFTPAAFAGLAATTPAYGEGRHMFAFYRKPL